MSIESLRARLGAATPGPWRADGREIRWPYQHNQTCAVKLVAEANADVLVPGRRGWRGTHGGTAKANAELIAHAPVDLRLALDVIEKARAVKVAEDGSDEDAWSDALDALQMAVNAFEALP